MHASGNEATAASTDGEPDFVERLQTAAWMVGNMDTPEDKAALWAIFRPLFDEVAQDPMAQDHADREFKRQHRLRTARAAA